MLEAPLGGYYEWPEGQLGGVPANVGAAPADFRESHNRDRKAATMASPTLPPSPTPRPLGSAPLDWPATSGPDGDTARALSSRIVALLREQTGRGPTAAKAIISSDLVVITLADCLTTAERHVAAAGHGELVTRTRETLHQGMEAEATAIVEELTHRSVSAYLTAQHHDPDLAILVFYLAT